MTPALHFRETKRSSAAGRAEVTVGASGAMFIGSDHLAIQGAVDYLAKFGGGDVLLAPGEYELRNSIRLAGGVRLIGSGQDQTILRHQPSAEAALIADSDWHEWQIRVDRPAAFQNGDGITVTSTRLLHPSLVQITRHTVIRKEADTLLLDSQSRLSHWVMFRARAVSMHPLVEAQLATDLAIRDLSIDGNATQNEEMDGNFGAAIFLHDCERVKIDNVGIRNYRGDGISWQIAHDVTVEGCSLTEVTGRALHPGSGSLRSRMLGNTIRDCSEGIYWCWGVTHGIASANRISECALHGISIGHRDDDNIIEDNDIANCAGYGIFIRPEEPQERRPRRLAVRSNRILCSGDSSMRGVSVPDGCEELVMADNVVSCKEETHSG